MNAQKGKKRSQTRKAVKRAKAAVRVSRKAKANPKLNLSLTDRMREQGYTGEWRYLSGKCALCGGKLATDGETVWCVGGGRDGGDFPIRLRSV